MEVGSHRLILAVLVASFALLFAIPCDGTSQPHHAPVQHQQQQEHSVLVANGFSWLGPHDQRLWTVDAISNGSDEPPAVHPRSTAATRFSASPPPCDSSRPPSSGPPQMAALAGALAPPLPFRLPPRPLPHPRLLAPSSSSLRPRLAVARAASGGDGGPPAEPPPEGDKERRGPSLPSLSEIRWGDLLSPEPANAAAVVLTGALTWAGASLLLQLLLIFGTIFVAAVKYSFIAAILLFILIALL